MQSGDFMATRLKDDNWAVRLASNSENAWVPRVTEYVTAPTAEIAIRRVIERINGA